MMIKMLLEEAGQYFYCEARKTTPQVFEGIVHFLHKVGDGNAFVRGKTHYVKTTFDSRTDALAAAELYGRNVAMQLGPVSATRDDWSYFDNGLQNSGWLATQPMEKSTR